jgi:DNA-binding SARP family transcriptional activator
VEQPAVEVCVLGPVAMSGAPAPFRRRAALELVVYLAFHPDGVTQQACACALWPDRAVSSATMHSTVSDARRALGRDAAGSWLLPRGAVLRLASSVTTDVERFASLCASSGPGALERASALLRGTVFAGLRQADWAVFDGTGADVEALVVDATLRGAAQLVERGDGDRAERVIRRALRVAPYDERLYRALLRATAAQGNRVRLHATMAGLRMLAADVSGTPVPGEGGGQPALLHPHTTALYRDLLRGPPAARRHPSRL